MVAYDILGFNLEKDIAGYFMCQSTHDYNYSASGGNPAYTGAPTYNFPSSQRGFVFPSIFRNNEEKHSEEYFSY